MSENKTKMVDITEKPIVKRKATASGKISLKEETIKKIRNKQIKKGDPITVGKIAAINAVKQTPLLIPMCHQIPITMIDFETDISERVITVFVTVTAEAKTGVEMEALVGVTTFLNVIWDMTKYLEKDENGQYPTTKISDIKVISKEKEKT